MPRFDKTGPQGQCPLTGRGLGSCSVNRRDTDREQIDNEKGVPKRDGAGKGIRANIGRGGCVPPRSRGSK